MISLQLFIFLWISLSFIICLGWVVGTMVYEAISDIVRSFRGRPSEPVRHEAVIFQFRPRTKRGGVHVQ